MSPGLHRRVNALAWPRLGIDLHSLHDVGNPLDVPSTTARALPPPPPPPLSPSPQLFPRAFEKQPPSRRRTRGFFAKPRRCNLRKKRGESHAESKINDARDRGEEERARGCISRTCSARYVNVRRVEYAGNWEKTKIYATRVGTLPKLRDNHFYALSRSQLQMGDLAKATFLRKDTCAGWAFTDAQSKSIYSHSRPSGKLESQNPICLREIYINPRDWRKCNFLPMRVAISIRTTEKFFDSSWNKIYDLTWY